MSAVTPLPVPQSMYADFVSAQREFGKAIKSSTNPYFKSKYADLSVCMEAVLGPLNSYNFSLIQKTHPTDRPNAVAIETVLLHTSGEHISSGILVLPCLKEDPQSFGGALTYARRYSLLAVCGLAPEDDDGEAAAGRRRATADPCPRSLLEQGKSAAKLGTIKLTDFVNKLPHNKKELLKHHKVEIWELAKKADHFLREPPGGELSAKE